MLRVWQGDQAAALALLRRYHLLLEQMVRSYQATFVAPTGTLKRALEAEDLRQEARCAFLQLVHDPTIGDANLGVDAVRAALRRHFARLT